MESLHVTPLLAFMGLGTVELMIVAGVILLLFGSRLPKVMRSLGEGIVEFKRGVQGIEDDPHASHSGNASHSDRSHESGRVESHR
jgi:sec-independent protein translocase protein TatA